MQATDIQSGPISPELGFRPEFMYSNMLLGRHLQIKLPTGEVHNARFAIVELDAILASHNEESYASTIGYPLDSVGENINDRNYKDDVNSQQKIREYAQGLESDRLITTSRTPAGTPIVTKDGIVISGNNRTMSLKLAAKEHPEKYKEYCQFLSEEAMAFGFKDVTTNGDRQAGYGMRFEATEDGTAFKLFRKPVLVRIDYDTPEYSTLELSKFNKDTKKSERPIDKAIKLGKILRGNEQCQKAIADIVGKYETFTDFYANHGDQRALKNALLECNILTSQELPAYYDERGFTEQGKELVENLLAGMVLTKEALIASTEGNARVFKQRIITALPVLIANLSLGEESLLPELSEAVLIQSKLASSKITFLDILSQGNLFGERSSEWGMYMNRLLASGPHKFKGAMENYNALVLDNSQASLFGEKLSKAEMFTQTIASKIDPGDSAAIKNTYSDTITFNVENTNPESEPIKAILFDTKTMHNAMNGNVDIPLLQPIENSLINGNFFKRFPDKVLAETKQSVSRFKKPITVYLGSIADVERIDAPEDFLTAFEAGNPTVSNEIESAFSATETNTEVVDNFLTAIEASKVDEKKKTARAVKVRKVEKDYTSQLSNIETTSLSIAQVYSMINPEIGIEELRVFLWYKNKKGRPITNSDWFDIADITSTDLYYNPEHVKNWVNNGLLYYFNGELLPAYLYLAENVYDKKNRLVQVSEESENSGGDKDYIIKTYGQEVYDNQVKALNEIFSAKDGRRLLIKGEGATDGLVLLPISKMARTFMIKTLADETPFKWKKITAASNKNFGKMDYMAVDINRSRLDVFEELSLLEGYMYWLRTNETVPFHKGLSYADIIEVYLMAKPKPATSAVKDENGGYSPEQYAILKRETEAWERLKSKTKQEGDRLFTVFLDSQLTLNDKIKLEYQWNRQYNGYVPINYNKVPVAFKCNEFIDGAPAVIEPEKREAVAFNVSEGAGCIAYDVGVGKTPSAIFTMSQVLGMGYAERPLIVVPNQTYKQWISEFKKFAAHIPINDLYNLSAEYLADWTGADGKMRQVPFGSVTIVTYEGMKLLGFNEDTVRTLKPTLMDILMQIPKVNTQQSDKQKDRQAEALNSNVEKLIGKALAKTVASFEDFGFDYMTFDEAHAAKKVFTFVRGESESTGKQPEGRLVERKTREVVRYEIRSGEPSFTGVKAFMLCQYIQRTYGGNTCLLTATPFTNSPLEVFSMLAMVAWDKLVELRLDNLGTFFENYVAVSYEMIINSRLRPERKQVILGFNNLISLQTLVRRFINYKSGDQVPSVVKKRPNKMVLPMRKKVVDGVTIELNENERVDTVLPLTEIQARLMELVKEYANGDINEAQLCTGPLVDEDEDDADTTQAVEVDETYLNEDEKKGVRTLKAMSHARNLALSPYLFDCAGLGTPTADQYIETSNKLLYTVKCIESIKKHHAANNQPMSGIIIYMDRGKKYFPLIKEYLVKHLGFEPHEIGIMSSGIMEPIERKMSKEDQKEYIKNLFLGQRYNPVTMDMEDIPANERIKVLICSSMAREGINLQKYTSTLFNLWLDWNPSDQQQLYGRFYRQGNIFEWIRAVVPLMINSLDIFIFQKLEEKTSRINDIWQSDGRTNVFNIEEFNPHDLKYALIEDPRVLAEMELLETSEKIDEDILDIGNRIKRNEKIKQYEVAIGMYESRLKEWLEEYRPSNGRSRTLDSLIGLSQEVLKTQKDAQGKPMVHIYMQAADKKYTDFYSNLSPATKQYWFDDLVYAFRNLKRETRDYLTPNNLTAKDMDAVNVNLTKEIDNLKERKTKLTSDEAIHERAMQIAEERARNKITVRPVHEVVQDFERTNYLLDKTRVPVAHIASETTCPPVDENGNVRIDQEGLALLDQCINREPSTKRMHTYEVQQGDTVNRVYTEDRERLHKEIIKKFTKNAVCTERIQPIAVLTGGAPGSGKSTFINKYAPYLNSDHIIKVDADEIRANLPEYKGWNAHATHEETRDLVNELLESLDFPCKHDLLFDGTMTNSQKYIALINKLKKLGYKVYIAYMEIPKQIAKERALKRYADNKGGQTKYGRYVPLTNIDDFYSTGLAGFEAIKDMVDGYVLIDGLTQTIIDKGGEPMPADRNYKGMFDNAPEAIAPELTKADIAASIAGAKVAIPFLEGQDKKDMQDYLRGLKVTLEYL